MDKREKERLEEDNRKKWSCESESELSHKHIHIHTLHTLLASLQLNSVQWVFRANEHRLQNSQANKFPRIPLRNFLQHLQTAQSCEQERFHEAAQSAAQDWQNIYYCM